MSKPVYCYIILCENRSFYTGWTNNIAERFKKHINGAGSRYTKLNRPLKVIYWETCKNKSFALKREKEIKRLKRKQKEKIVMGWGQAMNLPDDFNEFEYLSIAPGRVNLIGEHIDYNGGAVLPAAIDRHVYLGANKHNDDNIKINSFDFDQTISFSIKNIGLKVDQEGIPLPEWALYPAGVIWSALQHNLPVHGFEGIFSSTVPIGAGLSSSAAVEVAFAALLREFCGWEIDNLELAKICQYAENEFIGVACGLMDQFASANGIKNSALYFDTSNLEWFPVKLPENIALVITNSKLPRSLSNSAYNERRNSCETALKIFQKKYPEKKNLSEISIKEFENSRDLLGEVISKRVEHVVYECDRVKQSKIFLEENKIVEFGKLMNDSHNSLRDLYEVSTPELDLLVMIARSLNGCYGSRLTGAGFGGCIISLVEKKFADKFVKNLEKEYIDQTKKEVETYVCEASDGVSVRWHEIP